MARAFARGARAGGARRLVYLGGLYPDAEDLSPHLDSRKEVGEILLDSGVPTTVLRAAVILGLGLGVLRDAALPDRAAAGDDHPAVGATTGSSRSPSATCCGTWSAPPTWTADVSRGFDIGGPDVLTYREMMRRYAAAAGLPRRRIFPVNVLTPRLSSHWVGVVTPVPNSLARPLVESLVHEVVCKEHDIARYVPDPRRRAGRLRPGARARAGQGAGVRRGHLVVVGQHPRHAQRPAAQRPGLGRRHAVRRRALRAGAGAARPRCGRSSRASAARTAGTAGRWAGGRAACWTG